MQYARLTKKAFLDLKNGRGDAKTHVSKIIYYGFIQNVIFNALQQAVFALGFGDDDEEEDENKQKKYQWLNIESLTGKIFFIEIFFIKISILQWHFTF